MEEPDFISLFTMNVLLITLYCIICYMSKYKIIVDEEIYIQLLQYNHRKNNTTFIKSNSINSRQYSISDIIRSVEISVVERLLNGYGKEANKTIIHESRTYSGLGNQVRSLVGSMAIALASGRKLRSKTIGFHSL